MNIYLGDFILGFWVSYLASLPPGMISLSMIETTIHRGLKQGAILAFGAVFVEFFQAYLACKFSLWLQGHPVVDQVIQVSVIPIFIGLGIYYFIKSKEKGSLPVSNTTPRKRHALMKGMVVSLLNPVAIPFWAFYALVFQENGWLILENYYLFAFVMGVVIGTWVCLMTYGIFASLIRKRLQAVKKWVNIIIGIIFILLGIYQIYRLVSS